MIHFLLLCIAVMLLHYCYIHYNARGRILNKIPGPRFPLPVVGNLIEILGHLGEIFDYGHRQIFNKYYPIARGWKFLSDVGIIIYHPDDIKLLLTSKVDLNKSNIGYEVFKEYDMDGVFVSKDAKWKNRRKMIESSMKNAALKIPALKMSTKIMNTQAKSLMNNINLQGDVTVQNIFLITLKYTFQVVYESLLGFNNWNNSDSNVDKILKAYKTTTNFVAERYTVIFIPMRVLELFPRGRETKKALKAIRELSMKILDERVEYLKNKQINSEKKDDDEKNSSADAERGQLIPLIDILLQYEAEGLIDRRGVIEEIYFVIIGGYETSGTTLAFCLILLAENKWAQDLARKEILNVVNGSKDEVTHDMVQNMPFLERCLKETMRLFAPAPFILRRLSEEKLMSNYVIPADTDVAIDIYSVHRNPRFWPDPEKFDPDRFLPERMKDQHAYAYIPFSSGLRGCPGQKFGYLTLKAGMAQFLRNYYIEPVTKSRDLDFGPTMVLHPMSPAYVKLIKINDN